MECDGADHPLCRAGDLLVSIDKRERENVCVCGCFVLSWHPSSDPAILLHSQNLPATANHLSTAHTFATLLSSEDFYVRAMESRKTAAMCRCVLDFVNQNLAKQER